MYTGDPKIKMDQIVDVEMGMLRLQLILKMGKKPGRRANCGHHMYWKGSSGKKGSKNIDHSFFKNSTEIRSRDGRFFDV